MNIPAEIDLFPRVRIILIETTHPGNIGAVARAMKNMGLAKLVLVAPRQYPHDKATWRSSNATDVLDAAEVVETVEEAIAGCQLVIGTSARDRRIPWPMLDPKGCGQKVFTEHEAGQEIGILFGREAHGLKNEELQLCHFHVNIPTGKAYSSLNLAMAVQVICYEILQAKLAGEPEEDYWDQEYATTEAMENFFEHMEQTLLQTGFHDPENPRQLMTRIRRMFNRVRLDKMEVNILRGFLTSVNQKLDK